MMRSMYLFFWDVMIFCRATCGYEIRDVHFKRTWYSHCSILKRPTISSCMSPWSFVTSLQDDTKDSSMLWCDVLMFLGWYDLWLPGAIKCWWQSLPVRVSHTRLVQPSVTTHAVVNRFSHVCNLWHLHQIVFIYLTDFASCFRSMAKAPICRIRSWQLADS